MQFPRSLFRRSTQNSEGKPVNKDRRSFARRMVRWVLCRRHQFPKKSPKSAHHAVAARSDRKNIRHTGNRDSSFPPHAVSAFPSCPPKEASDEGQRQSGSQDTASGFTSTCTRADCTVQSEKKLPALHKGVEAMEAEAQEQPESSVPGDTLGHPNWLLERCNCWGWLSRQLQPQQQHHEEVDAYVTPEVNIESHPAKPDRSPSIQSAKSEEASEEGPRSPEEERHLQEAHDVEQTREWLRGRQLLFLSEKEKQSGGYGDWLLRYCGGPANCCSWALGFCTKTPEPTEADAVLAEASRWASRAAIAGAPRQLEQLYKEAQLDPIAGIRHRVLRRVRDEDRNTWLEYQQVTLFDNSVRLQWMDVGDEPAAG